MATRNSNSSATGDRDSNHGTNSSHSAAASIALIPRDSDEPRRNFLSSVGTITIGRCIAVDGKDDASASQNTYLTICPVVSRTHATIRWLSTGEVVIADSESHHGTYINDSLARLTPGQAYKLHDEDTVSFGKGIFKDGKFYPPHTVLVRFNVRPSSPVKTRSGTYGLTSKADPTRMSSVGSQSEATERQAERIRTEVQRLGRRREMATRHKRQLHDVSTRLDYLEKSAMEKASPQDIDLRLRSLERHYESLLEKLTLIEHNLRTPDQDNGSTTSERRRKHKQLDDGEETDDDELSVASKSPKSTSSTLGTVAMVLAGVAVTYTALAMS